MTLEMHIKIPSVEDAPDESPSIRVGIEDDMIGIETIYGSTSLPLADFDRVVDAVRDYRQGTGRGADPTGSGVGRMAKRSEEHTSELQSLMRISYAVLCLKK